VRRSLIVALFFLGFSGCLSGRELIQQQEVLGELNCARPSGPASLRLTKTSSVDPDSKAPDIRATVFGLDSKAMGKEGWERVWQIYSLDWMNAQPIPIRLAGILCEKERDQAWIIVADVLTPHVGLSAYRLDFATGIPFSPGTGFKIGRILYDGEKVFSPLVKANLELSLKFSCEYARLQARWVERKIEVTLLGKSETSCAPYVVVFDSEAKKFISPGARNSGAGPKPGL
jgi:hypothetical protein